MEIVESGAGEHISKVAQRMVEAAKKMPPSALSTVQAEFNGVTLYADSDSTVESIVVDFDRQIEERARAYRESPEGKAAARRTEAEREALQAKADALMAQLPLLRFDDVAALLDWLCEMEEPRDRIGVSVNMRIILQIFSAHGYEPNVNCDADFVADDADNVARWLIGQALSIPYVPMVRHFTEKWKAKFLEEPPR